MKVSLNTPRLALRPPNVTDAEAISRFLNDIEVSGNLARVPFPYSLEHAEAWLRTRLPDLPMEATSFIIERPGTGLIGQVGFHPGPAGPVIGYWLGRPYWGQGIMTEAVTASLDWFFSTSASPVVHSGVFHFNSASLAIQTKLGFTQTGRSTLLCLARGVEVEHIDTALTRSVWKARNT